MGADDNNFKVAVVGGGIGGVALTLALIERGVNVQLYKKAAKFGEYGAGLGFSGNSVRAMQICSPKIFDVFERVSTKPTSSSRPNVYFEAVDATETPSRGGFMQEWDGVSGGAHRGEFLEGMIKHLPDGVGLLNKQLLSITEDDLERGGRSTLHFADGSAETADVVAGFDGIGSQTRQFLVGKEHPAARAMYSHQYIYRMLIPMEKAVEALGEERAKLNRLYMAHGKSIICISISGGKLLSVALKVVDPNPWPSSNKLILPATKDEVLRDAVGLTPEFLHLLSNAKEHIDRWALYDLAENAPPMYARRRVCIGGDAAHATTPHLGVGAGFAMEDAATLAELLADPRVAAARGDRDVVHAALAAYQAIRMPRGHWLPPASRRSGDIMCYVSECGDDVDAACAAFKRNGAIAWEFNVDESLVRAREELGRLLALGGSGANGENGVVNGDGGMTNGSASS